MQMYLQTFEKADDFLNEVFHRHAIKNDIVENISRQSIVAYEGSKIVGAITFILFYGEAYIDEFAVMEEYRHQGIGSKLIIEVERYCKHRGVSHISLSTYEFQAPKFYKKMGYTVEFIRKNKIRKELDRYYFIKYLQ